MNILVGEKNVKFFITTSDPIRRNEHGSFVLRILPSALDLTHDARKCMCVDVESRAQISRHIQCIGIQPILKALRIDYMCMVDRVVSHCFDRPFDPAEVDVCALVEMGMNIFGRGTPMFMLFHDKWSYGLPGLQLRTFDGWDHDRSRYGYHYFNYLDRVLPGPDGEALPKRISDTEHERLRMRCMDEFTGEDAMFRIVSLYILGRMKLHSPSVNYEKRIHRLNRFLDENKDAITSLENPDIELKFDPREDWENLGLEAFCMLDVERLSKNSVWHKLPSFLIEHICRPLL